MTIPLGSTRSTMRYAEDMRGSSYDGLTRLHNGVDALVMTDFPDHENIGDSAIAMGQRAFWQKAAIRVDSTYSWRTLSPRVFESTLPVVIHGGGNFGGLYPRHGEHRYELAERLRQDTVLIQEPQSVYFVSDVDRAEFVRRLAGRPGLRLAVRDLVSLEMVRDHVPDVTLAPDSVHMLGRIDAPAPTSQVLYLLRRDDESALSADPGPTTVDWPAMTFTVRVRQRIARALLEGAVAGSSHRSTDRWFQDAARRVASGVALLAPGQTVVTDRLHAMLLALQMGRRVIAIDNANGKLTRYADTWLQGVDVPLTFASDLTEARRML